MRKQLYILGFLVIALSSCEKVIDVDLNDAEKKFVVEANLADQPGSALVRLSQTRNFDEDNDFPGISGATVTIAETGGTIYTLTEGNAGEYGHPTLQAISGKTYTLSVQINGQTFTSVCSAPVAVEIDSLFVTDEVLFGESQKTVNVRFQEPPGRGQAYRFIQYINDKKEKQILVSNDDYIDGRLVTSKLFYFADEDENEEPIKSGDDIRVEFLSIDPSVYLYWFSLARSSTGGSQQGTPSNPVSNIEGGALGYFSTHCLRTGTLVVP
jgi:hypothetical protein